MVLFRLWQAPSRVNLKRKQMSTNALRKASYVAPKVFLPVMTAEYMRAMITPPMRPSFTELEEQLRTAKRLTTYGKQATHHY